MPLFSVLGGLVVFAWSSRLYGRAAGCSAWRSGASARTSWPTPGWSPPTRRRPRSGSGRLSLLALPEESDLARAAWRGLVLGLAQLTKFSLILLYGLWPALAVVRFLLERGWEGWPRRLASGSGRGWRWSRSASW